MARHHPHRHIHPHLKGRKHHHAHLHPHEKGPQDAHHHRVRIGSSPPSIATRRVKKVWRWLFGFYLDAGSLGVYNCRKIAGSSRYSEHAWADALDFTRPGYPDSLFPVERALMGNQKRFRITRVIGPADNADHTNHLHVDLEPDHYGVPPCAQ